MGITNLVLLLALAPLGDSNDDDAEKDAKTLKTIRAAVHEQFTSIKSLELQYHEYRPEAKTHLTNYSWTISGNKFLLAAGPGPQTPGAPEGRSWFSFDGKKFYSINYEPADLDTVQSIARMSSLHPSGERALPRKLFGWRLDGADETLSALLDRPEASLVGEDDVDGHTCWKVDLGTVSYKGSPANHVTAWFDPEVGYWPRRLQSMPNVVPRPDGKSIQLRGEQIPWEYVATEFNQFDDQASGGKRWFPTRYRIVGAQRTIEIIFEGIKINPKISDEIFTPAMPLGTLITDDPGTPGQKSSYVGGKRIKPEK